jgi:hypothetical protein
MLYDRFHVFCGEGMLSVNSIEQLQRIAADLVPWWEYRTDLFTPLFRFLDTNSDNSLDFRDIALGLSPLCNGTLQERVQSE